MESCRSGVHLLFSCIKLDFIEYFTSIITQMVPLKRERLIHARPLSVQSSVELLQSKLTEINGFKLDKLSIRLHYKSAWSPFIVIYPHRDLVKQATMLSIQQMGNTEWKNYDLGHLKNLYSDFGTGHQICQAWMQHSIPCAKLTDEGHYTFKLNYGLLAIVGEHLSLQPLKLSFLKDVLPFFHNFQCQM